MHTQVYQFNNTISSDISDEYQIVKKRGLAVCIVDLQENQKDVGYGIPQQNQVQPPIYKPA